MNFFGSWFNDLAGIARLGRERRRHGARRHRVDGQPAHRIRREISARRSGSTTSTTTPDTHYVFGRIDQTTVGVSLRANYTIHPTLTLQIYARPFVSAGAYSDFKELVDGRAPRRRRPLPAVRLRRTTRTSTSCRSGRPTCSDGNTVRVRRSSSSGSRAAKTAVGRGISSGRDLGGAFDAPASNTVLIKVSRWLNF